MSNRHESIDERRRQLLAGMGALALGFDLAPLRAQANVSLRFLCPQGTLVQSALDGFAKSGAKVEVEVYPDAPAIFPKVAARDAALDVVVAPERVVARMIFANLLQNIDGKLVPNLKNIDPAFRQREFRSGPPSQRRLRLGHHRCRLSSLRARGRARQLEVDLRF
jgi:spermidine/putrescine transport system substrate-binding protein